MKLLVAVLLSLVSLVVFAASNGSGDAGSDFASKVVGFAFLAVIGYFVYRSWARKKAKAAAASQRANPPGSMPPPR